MAGGAGCVMLPCELTDNSQLRRQGYQRFVWHELDRSVARCDVTPGGVSSSVIVGKQTIHVLRPSRRQHYMRENRSFLCAVAWFRRSGSSGIL